MHRAGIVQSRWTVQRAIGVLVTGQSRPQLLLLKPGFNNSATEPQTTALRSRGFATIQESNPKMAPRHLRRVPLSDPEEVVKAIERDGGVILTGFATTEQVQQVNRDVQPYIDAPNDDRATFFLPKATTRCTRLFGRSETARETWLQQRDLSQILNHFLTTTSKIYQGVEEEKPDQSPEEWSTYPILSSAITFNIGPGGTEQFLHRDDELWQHKHDDGRETGYQVGKDIGMGVMVPGVRTREENGATLVIPGSHLWPDDRRGKRDEAVPIEMDVGEAFMFLSSVVHAGGANKTQLPRPAHGFFFCRWYLRPEENQYLWWKKEEVQKWSLAAQKQVGYVLENPILGHCDFTNPLDKFRVSGEDNQAM